MAKYSLQYLTVNPVKSSYPTGEPIKLNIECKVWRLAESFSEWDVTWVTEYYLASTEELLVSKIHHHEAGEIDKPSPDNFTVTISGRSGVGTYADEILVEAHGKHPGLPYPWELW